MFPALGGSWTQDVRECFMAEICQTSQLSAGLHQPHDVWIQEELRYKDP